MNSIRYAVIGLGRIGRLHCEILKPRIEGAELVAVRDLSKDLARSIWIKI